MIFFIFLISQNLLYAFNEDLTAVHYSIVTPGIDEEIKPGILKLSPWGPRTVDKLILMIRIIRYVVSPI